MSYYAVDPADYEYEDDEDKETDLEGRLETALDDAYFDNL